MERVEYKNAIGHNIMNKDNIEDFSSVQVLMQTVPIPNLDVKLWI